MIDRLRSAREWIFEPEHVEKASLRERVKRWLWMVVSSCITLGTALYLLAAIDALYGTSRVTTVVALWILGAAVIADVYVVWPWGIDRFDVVPPWQFRDQPDGIQDDYPAPPSGIRSTGIIMVVVSVAALLLILSRFNWLIIRHLEGAKTWQATRGTLQTWAREIWIETNFVPLGETVLAWTALAGIVVGIALIVWPYWRAES